VNDVPNDATTADMPAVDAGADIVDYRQPPDPASSRSGLQRRRYAGRHRPAPGPEPTRLGLSTAGMTVAVGVLGAALTFLHTDATPTAERGRTPLPVTVPTSAGPSSEDSDAPSPQAAPLMPGASTSPVTAAHSASPAPGAGAPVQGVPDADVHDSGGSATDGGSEQGGGGPVSTPSRAPSPRSGNPGKSATPRPAPGPTQVLASCSGAASTDPDGDDDNDPSANASKASPSAATRLDDASASPSTAADPKATPTPECP
jgi:hypothetical protein